MSEDILPADLPVDEVTTDDDAVDDATVRRTHRVARLLDDGVRLPVVGVRVGADPVMGVVPVVGDLLPALLGLYVVAEAWRLGVSRFTLARMLLNLGIDAGVGAVPVVGDLFDVGFRAHRRNLNLALADLDIEVEAD